MNKTYVPKTNTALNTADRKTYSSKVMKFAIDVPYQFRVEDTDVKLTLSVDTGQISIVRNGTNYDNLSDYLAEFDTRRNLTSSEINKISIDGKEAISRLVTFPEEGVRQKSYYIYADSWVYVLSTSSEALFSDLDQIAQSFRYTP